jgi:hypothetical protein
MMIVRSGELIAFGLYDSNGSHHFNKFNQGNNMRTVKELLDSHVSIYAANKALGMGKSINKLKDWANNGAIVDDNGQPYIKSGKVIEGWKR